MFRQGRYVWTSGLNLHIQGRKAFLSSLGTIPPYLFIFETEERLSRKSAPAATDCMDKNVMTVNSCGQT
jgi:hypothetical protein